MTGFPGLIENAMTGDNVEGSQQDENATPYSHWTYEMEASSPTEGKTPVQVEGNLTPKYFRWTYEMESHFLELLLIEVRMGNKVGRTFTSLAYRNILRGMQGTFGSCIQKNHLKNKIRMLKQNYRKFKHAFRGTSGFFWNWDTKKFDAEDDVWEALIKDNPAAASLRDKSCQHWDIMHTLWSSSQVVGINSSTVRKRSGRIQHQFESLLRDVPSRSTNNQSSSMNCAGSVSGSLSNETSDQAMHDASGSQPSAGSGKTKMKRKATADVILQSVGKIIASLDNLARAIIESAKILANKRKRPYDCSEELFTSLQALDLSREYLIECYDFLTEHEIEANMFLGIPHQFRQFRKDILTRIMNSASKSK